MTDAKALTKYLEREIKAIDAYPPDSDYQKGFLAAFLVVYEDLCMSGEERMKSRLLLRAHASCRLS